MIRHVSGIAEIVEDLDAAVKFYEDLGMTVKVDGPEYAFVEAPGILHFGLWRRESAAESTFGSREAVDKVPLGFCLALEVDDIDAAGKALGKRVLRGAQDEPWGQRTLRFSSPSGSVCEVCETPGARELETNVTPKASEVSTS